MKKRHHTVPRCYLQNFTDEKGFVWVLDTNNKIFNIKPENILVENHFYTITLKNGEKSLIIEDTLSDIEGHYAGIFAEKISKDEFLTDEERARVAIFISLMKFRTPSERESTRDMLNQVKDWAKNFNNKLKESPNKHAISEAIPYGGKSITLEELDDYIENFDENNSKSLIDHAIHVAQIIFDMKWAIVSCDDLNNKFVTSDDPFVMVRPRKKGEDKNPDVVGLLHKDVEVTLPLSKDKLFLAGWVLEKDCYVSMPKDNINNLNQRTIINSSKKIIASNSLQLEEIKSKYPPTVT